MLFLSTISPILLVISMLITWIWNSSHLIYIINFNRKLNFQRTKILLCLCSLHSFFSDDIEYFSKTWFYLSIKYAIPWQNCNFSTITELLDIFNNSDYFLFGIYIPRSEVTGLKDRGILYLLQNFPSKLLNQCIHLPTETELVCFTRSLQTTLVIIFLN